MYKVTLILLAALAVYASATPATNCSKLITNALDTTSVTITGCNSVPCRLTKGTAADISFTFTLSQDVTSLVNNAYAAYFGFQQPLNSISGTSACNNIYRASDNTPASCNLSSGVQYVYRNSITFPSGSSDITGTLHWALQSNSVNQVCFDISIQVS